MHKGPFSIQGPPTAWAVIFYASENTKYENAVLSPCFRGQSRMHYKFNISKNKIEKFSGAPGPTPTGEGIPMPKCPDPTLVSAFVASIRGPEAPQFLTSFPPMNSCDVFLYSVARPMFILAYTPIFVSLGGGHQ